MASSCAPTFECMSFKIEGLRTQAHLTDGHIDTQRRRKGKGRKREGKARKVKIRQSLLSIR